MRYFKLFLLANVLLCSGVLAAQTPLGACMEQGKKEFAGQDFVRARASFTKCLQLDNKNVDALLSLGGVCLKQDGRRAKLFFGGVEEHEAFFALFFLYLFHAGRHCP